MIESRRPKKRDVKKRASKRRPLKVGDRVRFVLGAREVVEDRGGIGIGVLGGNIRAVSLTRLVGRTPASVVAAGAILGRDTVETAARA